jgi:hypothetical protein
MDKPSRRRFQTPPAVWPDLRSESPEPKVEKAQLRKPRSADYSAGKSARSEKAGQRAPIPNTDDLTNDLLGMENVGGIWMGPTMLCVPPAEFARAG